VTTEQPLTIRLDPRVTATSDDLQIYVHDVRAIESIECSASRALSRVQNIDVQLQRLHVPGNSSIQDAAAAVARELRAIAAELAGGSDAPNALNLRAKIN
jgi:hypothetical protein